MNENISKLPPFYPVDREKAVSAAEKLARGLIVRNKGEFGVDTRKRIIKAEGEFAGAVYENSHHKNDDLGGPGVDAYLTPDGLRQAIERCQEKGFPIVSSGVVKASRRLELMRLPSGYYWTNGPLVQFSKYLFTAEGSGSTEFRESFNLDYDGVVRIESNEGKSWQNHNFNPDGTKKRK